MPEIVKDASREDVRILSRGVGKWKVRIQFSLERFKDNRELFLKINAVKRQLAKEINLPPQLLEFGDISERREEQGMLSVTVDIFKKAIKNGPLALHLAPAVSDYGVEFPDMIATIDLFIFDKLGALVTEEKVAKFLAKRNIDQDLIPWAVIRESLTRLLEDPTPIIGLEIARGEFPDPGGDAHLTFPSFEGVTLEEINRRVEDRRVSQGQVLVQKLPPHRGVRNGKNVRGEPIQSPMGRDIQIQAGRGAIINLNGTEITAQTGGLMMVEVVDSNAYSESGGGRKGNETIIRIKVNPLRVIKADQELDICTNSSVEIHGRVPAGSRIISSSEIIIKGDIEENVILESNNDIFVSGRLLGGSLTSQHNVVVSGIVAGGEIVAKDKVCITNSASDAQIIGSEVEVHELHGGIVIAKGRAVVGKIGAGKDGQRPEIRIGAEDFHEKRLQENRKFIDFGNSNLEGMMRLFGEGIVNMVTSTNLKSMFLRHARERRLETKSGYDRKQAQAVLRLLDSTSSIRELLSEKVGENDQLSKKIEEAMAELKELVILEGNSSELHVKLGTRTADVPASRAPVRLSQVGEEAITEEQMPAEASPAAVDQKIV